MEVGLISCVVVVVDQDSWPTDAHPLSRLHGVWWAGWLGGQVDSLPFFVPSFLRSTSRRRPQLQATALRIVSGGLSAGLRHARPGSHFHFTTHVPCTFTCRSTSPAATPPPTITRRVRLADNMLASRAASGNARRTAWLQLPSHLQSLAHQQSSSRFFSASASRKIDAVEIVATPPLAVLNGLHAIGIPWWAAIPASALLIRGVAGYYLSTVPARRRQQIRNNLQAFIMPWNYIRSTRFQDSKYASGTHEEARQRMNFLSGLNRIWETHVIGRQFGAPLLSWSSPLNFAALIATTEAVRMKCGASSGLMSILMTPFNWIGRKIMPEHFPPVVDPVEQMAMEMADKLERMRELRLQQAQEQGLVGEASSNVTMEDLSHQPPPPPTVSPEPSSWFDPTLQTEGLAWFTDLTVADPLGYLPTATGLIMMASILLNPLKKPVKVRPSMRPFFNRLPAVIAFPMTRYSILQLFGMTISCLFGIVLHHMPAGVVLYFLTSVSTNLVQKRWLDWKMPLRPGILPCGRSTRVRSKKRWSARQ